MTQGTLGTVLTSSDVPKARKKRQMDLAPEPHILEAASGNARKGPGNSGRTIRAGGPTNGWKTGRYTNQSNIKELPRS